MTNQSTQDTDNTPHADFRPTWEEIKNPPGTVKIKVGDFGLVVDAQLLKDVKDPQNITMLEICELGPEKYVYNTMGPALMHLDPPEGKYPYAELWIRANGKSKPIQDEIEFNETLAAMRKFYD